MKIEKQNPGFAKRVKSWLTGKYVENGSTASQNIPAGKWVIWKGQLCQASSAITTGDTLSSANLTEADNGAINRIEDNVWDGKSVTFAAHISGKQGSNVWIAVPYRLTYGKTVAVSYNVYSQVSGETTAYVDYSGKTSFLKFSSGITGYPNCAVLLTLKNYTN